MTVEFVDGIVALVGGVRRYFEVNEIPAVVALGWTKRYRQDNQGPGGACRVVFTPGVTDGSGGAPKVLRAGRIDRDAEQGQVVVANGVRLRALGWWHAPYTVSVWGVNPERPTDEAEQIIATKRLLQLTIRAMHNAVDPVTGQGAGFANIEELGDVNWTLPPGEMAFGRELTFGFVLLEPEFDQPIELAFPGPAIERDPPA